MCDTLCIPSGITANRATLFGKNSDRQRNEAHHVELLAGADHPDQTHLQCTYIAIPQVSRTATVLICRPFWIWGAEMGANEHGVVIGNEGLQARVAAPRTEALTGMDLVRLALERSRSAEDAVDVITSLLREWGQGGNCGHIEQSFYHNGFVIADAQEAFVLETVDREWIVERIRVPRAISNRYSIVGPADLQSAGLDRVLRDMGWDGTSLPDLASTIAAPAREHIGFARARAGRAAELLDLSGEIACQATLMAVLRDHHPLPIDAMDWGHAVEGARSLCMHAGTAEAPGQTTGSMVSELFVDHAIHWVTASAAPCLSIFKPVLMDAPLPFTQPPSDKFDIRARWWRHEQLHRLAISSDMKSLLGDFADERNVLEAEFVMRIAAAIAHGDRVEKARVVEECWRNADNLEAAWLARLRANLPDPPRPFGAWGTLSRQAEVPLS